MRVLFFSVLQDLTGSDEVARETAATTLGGLLDELFEKFPDLKKWDGRLLYAVNQEFADRRASLPDDAEIAIMPPVQGG